MADLKRIIIFGATSAIAERVARVFVARGSSVYCIARNEARLQAVLSDLRVRAAASQIIEGSSADLVDTTRHAELVEQAVQALGGVDGVLIAHGTLPDQAACEADYETAAREIQVNALSVISLLTILANRMAAQESGVLAVISSVAGDRGRQSNYVYGAAKGMVSLFLQGLRNRLHKRGVHVVTIKPGFVDTPMTAEFDKSGPLWAKPDSVARGIVSVMVRRRDVVYLPFFWRWIMLVIRLVPERIFKRLSL